VTLSAFPERRQAPKVKSFLFLFFKKEILSSCPSACGGCDHRAHDHKASRGEPSSGIARHGKL
jgi:hypothetical protein